MGILGGPSLEAPPAPDLRAGAVQWQRLCGLQETSKPVADLGPVIGDGMPDWGSDAPLLLPKGSLGQLRKLRKDRRQRAVASRRMWQGRADLVTALLGPSPLSADLPALPLLLLPHRPPGAVELGRAPGNQLDHAGPARSCFARLHHLGDLAAPGPGHPLLLEAPAPLGPPRP